MTNTKINFGKYLGFSWSSVPTDYLIWCVENMREDIKILCRVELANRSWKPKKKKMANQKRN